MKIINASTEILTPNVFDDIYGSWLSQQDEA